MCVFTVPSNHVACEASNVQFLLGLSDTQTQAVIFGLQFELY